MRRPVRNLLLGVAGTLISTAVFASAPPPVSVSEPGVFSLLGAGVVAAVVVARFIRRK